MDEVGQGAAAPQRAGEVLRAARERQGMSLAEVAQRTRVPLRHLEAIEASDYGSLPSHTYATGFAKAYARAVGADEVEIARQVRGEVDRIGRRVPEYQPYQAPDPARVPSRGLVAVALGLALALAILAGLWFGTDLFRGGWAGGTTGAVVTPPVAGPAPVVAPTATPTPAAGGQVTLTARDEVWMRVYEAGEGGRTLYLGTLKSGERFDLPADAMRPLINVGRPDQLAITLNGSAVPPLGDGRRALQDVPIDGASLAARANGARAPAATPAAAATEPARRTSRVVPPARPRRPLTETQRANLASRAAMTRAAGER
jgi:cytoskeleton protein RodZ